MFFFGSYLDSSGAQQVRVGTLDVRNKAVTNLWDGTSSDLSTNLGTSGFISCSSDSKGTSD